MGIVAELVKKASVGQLTSIVSAGSQQADLEAFQTVVAEAQALRDAGEIEIVEELADRVRFKRLR